MSRHIVYKPKEPSALPLEIPPSVNLAAAADAFRCLHAKDIAVATDDDHYHALFAAYARSLTHPLAAPTPPPRDK